VAVSVGRTMNKDSAGRTASVGRRPSAQRGWAHVGKLDYALPASLYFRRWRSGRVRRVLPTDTANWVKYVWYFVLRG